MYTNVPNVVRIDLFCRPWKAKETLIVSTFSTLTSCGGTTSNVETNLNVGAQLQTFPYTTTSKPLRSSNAFSAKSFSQTLPFQSVMERQPDKNSTLLTSNAFWMKSFSQTLPFKSVTDKQTKTQHFWFPRKSAMSESHWTWKGDRGPQARSCTSKAFGRLTHRGC